MSRLNLFIIHYKFFEKSKSFILRNAEMNNSDAWHWASCDVGGSAPTTRQARWCNDDRPLLMTAFG